MAAIDLTGQTFGDLTVLCRSGTSGHKGEACWLCRCVCGAEKVIRSDKLRSGQRSCGCYRPPSKPKSPKLPKKSRVNIDALVKRLGDLTGRTFNHLTVIEPVLLRKRKLSWRCKCVCGNERLTDAWELETGHVKSCGCICVKHGIEGSSEYHIWGGMVQRCRNPNHVSWRSYGGRGIEVRFQSFEEFYNEIGPRPSPELSVDRINNDGHYEKGNVRWATHAEQMQNRCGHWRHRPTHCKQGHEFTPENTRVNKRGWRTCRKCAAIKTAEFVARNREACYANARAWRAANREKAIASTRRWHERRRQRELAERPARLEAHRKVQTEAFLAKYMAEHFPS